MNTKTNIDSRPWQLLLLLVAALAVALTITACGGDDSSTTDTAAAPVETEPVASTDSDAPDTIRVGYQLIPNGDLIVKHNGWLEEAFPNSEIKWIKFDSGGDVNTAAAAGSIDFGLAGSAPVSNGIASGIEYRVPWIHDVIGKAESLVATSDSGVTDVAGLVGKKVAAPFASTTHYSLLAALKKAGVDPDQVKIVDLEPDAILAAWTRGDIDAAYVWSPTLDELIASGGKVLEDSANLAKEGTVTADLAIVTTAFADEYPDAVQSWVDAQNRAVELYDEDPQAAAEAIAAELSIKPQEALKQTKGLEFLTAAEQAKPDFLGSPEQPGELAGHLQATAKFLVDLGQLNGKVDRATFERALAPQFVNAVSGG